VEMEAEGGVLPSQSPPERDDASGVSERAGVEDNLVDHPTSAPEAQRAPTQASALREAAYLAAFAKHGDNKAAVAQELGVTRQAVQQFVAKRPHLLPMGHSIPARKKLR
jgi:transcriptional regulator with PAS, ATPase and Fis domain